MQLSITIPPMFFDLAKHVPAQYHAITSALLAFPLADLPTGDELVIAADPQTVSLADVLADLAVHGLRITVESASSDE